MSMTEEDRDKLAGILYAAHAPYFEENGWADLKREFPRAADAWLRVADAAVKAIVVVKVGDP